MEINRKGQFWGRRRGKKEGEGSKGGDDGDNNNAGEGEEMEGAIYLEDASYDDDIYSAIASGQGTTTTNAKYAKDDDDEEGRLVVITQF